MWSGLTNADSSKIGTEPCSQEPEGSRPTLIRPGCAPEERISSDAWYRLVLFPRVVVEHRPSRGR